MVHPVVCFSVSRRDAAETGGAHPLQESSAVCEFRQTYRSPKLSSSAEYEN